MKNLVIDGRVIGLLEQLRDRLRDDPLAGVGDLPKYLPDGRQVKTLAQMQAIEGMSRFAAAVKVLQAEEAPRTLVSEARTALKDVYAGSGATSLRQGLGTRRRRLRIVERAGALAQAERRKRRKRGTKALYGQPDSDFDGIAIMLGFANKREAERIAVPGGLKPDQLHVTLAYYGEIDNAGMKEYDLIESAMKVAEDFEPFIANLNGITRFTAPEKDPIVVNVDSPVIERLRNRVVALCGEPKSEHGFTPHMTLAYVDQDDENPIRRYAQREARFDHLVVGWGDKHTKINLGSPKKKEED